jgi:glucosylceramidase
MLNDKSIRIAIVTGLGSLVLAYSCFRLSSSGSSQDNSGLSTNGINDVSYWLTQGDQTVLLQKQNVPLVFATQSNNYPVIDIDSTQTFQTIDGFGFTLTGGSASVINQMDPATKMSLLNELFGRSSSSIGISCLRLSIGSSDLNAQVFSYDDMPAGQIDTGLMHFNLNPDKAGVINLLKQILLINPAIKIMATPWSAPVWMKDNGSSSGGHLQANYFGTYANYFVKYIEQMKLQGIPIDAIAPQNEPLNPDNNPSMVMQAGDEASFIKGFLGPAFRASGITTKIVVYDHNCDRPDYPDSILSDIQANPYVNGSAFHLYAGNITALSQLHTLFPNKQLYFTEQYTASTGVFSSDLQWHIDNVIIGSMRNWSRNALEWNLANDASYGPHTPGGCTTCKGALTITGSNVQRNVGYYIIAHASKFIPAGSVRIGSTVTNTLQTAAFLTPAGKKVMIVENNDQSPDNFNIRFNGKWVITMLPAGAAATYVW